VGPCVGGARHPTYDRPSAAYVTPSRAAPFAPGANGASARACHLDFATLSRACPRPPGLYTPGVVGVGGGGPPPPPPPAPPPPPPPSPSSSPRDSTSCLAPAPRPGCALRLEPPVQRAVSLRSRVQNLFELTTANRLYISWPYKPCLYIKPSSRLFAPAPRSPPLPHGSALRTAPLLVTDILPHVKHSPHTRC
jgi:hypothetical protein